jgi:hypothetical protein
MHIYIYIKYKLLGLQLYSTEEFGEQTIKNVLTLDKSNKIILRSLLF